MLVVTAVEPVRVMEGEEGGPQPEGWINFKLKGVVVKALCPSKVPGRRGVQAQAPTALAVVVVLVLVLVLE